MFTTYTKKTIGDESHKLIKNMINYIRIKKPLFLEKFITS